MKFELYNKQGQVENPEIAKEMAETEKPYRERKILGLFKNKQEIKKGEKHSEAVGKYHIDKLNKEQELQGIAENVKSLELLEDRIKLEFRGHQIEIVGKICQHRLPPRGREVFSFDGTTGTIDGNELSKDDLRKITKKLSDYIVSKAGNEKIEEARNRDRLEREKKDELERMELTKQEEVKKLDAERQEKLQIVEQERQGKLSEDNKQLVEDMLK
ncbi:MAG: hypothetical protein WAX81_05755 [Candidatus Moraniibacteriota bacterium]